MFHGIWWVPSVYKIKIKSCMKYMNLKILAIENIQIETQRKKAERGENERSSVLWGKNQE